MINLRKARIASAGLVLVAMLQAGCSTEEPSAGAAASTAAPSPISDGTLDEYLQHHGVTAIPLTSEDRGVVSVGVQQPPGWLAIDRYQIPNTYLVLTNKLAADDGFAPNAVILVNKLTGAFDPRQAILRGFVDTQRYKDFKQSRASLDDQRGLPSALIEGSYTNDKNQILHVLNHYVIAPAKDTNYIVLLSITTTEAQALKLADDIKTLDQNFTVGTH